ncbi:MULTISPECIES: hypothetical protein [Cryobacterium]|jgi:hypothetical protein|uniref:DUF7455 domain-containing protein n=1 Tax=Cryobacterium glucosi TaxID=1259175 RepID=A0ABY2IQ42_9MICO|nr:MULTISPECIES: hypothetical protein [Cryobacterium]MDY7527712.1 hypothetical protein [Cryobacterium sp. 10C2]MDY7556514.1 hypothetical protein [Cryobacterium sp. 10C3]MEB0001509.1 hypothetical protein [Cryobacterium sp. RTC2.1]MEB0200259.1 hypothetical protein [Cryobacterium sp. 5I3]MEB0285161.1 hypothetical protein [Cryobacterium sp. 10S3]
MSQIAAHGAIENQSATHQLTAADRCDACGAQAYIRVSVNNSELMFCAHHGRKHQEKLSAIADSWHDESSRLLEDQRS